MRVLTNTEAFAIAIKGSQLSQGWSKWYTVRPEHLRDVGVFRHGYLSQELVDWLDENNPDGEAIRLVHNFEFKLQFRDESTLVAYLLKFSA
jgi:hypothetical protein